MRRYTCKLALRFERREGREGLRVANGMTTDLSRKAMRFETDEPPPVGSQIKVYIAWPFLLQNVCRLELVVRGTVLSVDARGTVMRINSYEFQTCGDKAFTEPVPTSSGSRVA